MPQWGMQGLVNGWVKVNNKHVVFPQARQQTGPADDSEREVQLRNDISNAEQRHGSRRKIDRAIDKAANQGGDTATTSSSSQGGPKQDPELRAIRRVTSRKSSTRLQRTVSHSDLLREMALAQEQDDARRQARRRRQPEVSSNGSSSRPRSNQSASLKTVQHTNRRVTNDRLSQSSSVASESNSSLRWVTGLFDTKPQAGKPSHLHSQDLRHIATTGKYLNETAFVQQYEQSKMREANSSTRRLNDRTHAATTLQDAPSCRLTGDARIDVLDQSRSSHEVGKRSSPVAIDDSSVSSANIWGRDEIRVSVNATSSHRSKSKPSTEPPGRKQANGFQLPWTGKNINAPARCQCCEELEGKLLSVQADLEYLRSLSLRSKAVCDSCGRETLSNRTKKYPGESSSRGFESSALNEASLRLMEVTERNQMQTEQITREWARRQNDMHLKLSKYARMCKLWNEECTAKNEQIRLLESELSEKRAERDVFAGEIQTLRAELDVHKQREHQLEHLHEKVSEYEKIGLNFADETIGQRDSIIQDLTIRLQLALDTLRREREQQRQRRHIIFPSSRTAQPSLDRIVDKSEISTVDPAKLNDQLKKAQTEAMAFQCKWKAAKDEAARQQEKLEMLQSRCHDFEAKLKASNLE